MLQQMIWFDTLVWEQSLVLLWSAFPPLYPDQSSAGTVRETVYISGRAFPVAGPTIWNSLPDNLIPAPSLSTFRQCLKTFLFQASFPDIIIDPR